MKWVALITTPHPCITDAIRLPKPKPLPPPTPQQSEIKVLSNIRWRSGMKQLQLIATVAPRSPLPDHSYYNTHLHQLTLVWDVISSLKAVHSNVNFCIDHTGTSFYMLSSQFYVRKSGYNSRGKVEHTHVRYCINLLNSTQPFIFILMGDLCQAPGFGCFESDMPLISTEMNTKILTFVFCP